jgi:hypothetical protein
MFRVARSSTMGTYTHNSRDEITPGQLQAFASRSVQFLNTIEQTIAACESDKRLFEVLIEDTHRILNRLQDRAFDAPLDPEGRISELLKRGAEAAQRLYNRELARLDSAIADKRLNSEDGVVDAFKSLVARNVSMTLLHPASLI